MFKEDYLKVYFLVAFLSFFAGSSTTVYASNLDTSATSSDDIASTILKGFAKWNASRVEKIILDQGLSAAAENQYMVRMFPTATSMITTYQFTSAKALLPMIQDSVQYDIDRFTYVFEQCFPKKLKKIAGAIDPNLVGAEDAFAPAIVALENLSKSVNNFFQIDTSSENTQKSAFDIKKDYEYSKDFLLQFTQEICEAEDIKAVSSGNSEEARKTLKEATPVDLSEEDFKRLAVLYIKSKGTKNTDAVISLIAAYRQLHSVFANPDSYALKLHSIITTLDRVGGYSEKYYPSFAKFQNLGFFFVSMVEAGENKDADLVARLLETYTDTQAAYQDKRKPGGFLSSYSAAVYPEIENKPSSCDSIANAADKAKCEKQGREFFDTVTESNSVTKVYTARWVGFDMYIASYYGISGVKIEDIDTGEDELTYRFFGPVGFEVKLATCNACVFGMTGAGTLGLNYSPIDIGGYITNELMNDTYSPSIEDAISPSLFLSYTLRNYPVAFLIGTQHNIRVDKDKKDDSGFLSIAFDLPVATIF